MLPLFLHELLSDQNCSCSAGFVVADASKELSKDAIRKESLSIAAALSRFGVGHHHLVAVFLPEHASLASAISAVSLVGATAIPLSESIGSNRIKESLRFLGPSAVVHGGATKELSALIAEFAWPAVDVRELAQVEHETRTPTDLIDLDNGLAMLTSGTTAGRAKAVGMAHHSVLGVCEAIARYLEITAQDRILMFSPASFDYGLYQLFIAALRGARVDIPTNAARRFPGDLAKFIVERGITVLPLTPASSRQLVPVWQRAPLHGVRLVTFTGSPFPSELVEVFSATFPGARIVPMYGITEAKRCSYLPDEAYPGMLPSVGIPIPNSRIRVLDDEGNEVPPGRIGEFEIESRSVMNGYIGEPDAATGCRLRGPGRRHLLTGDFGYRNEQGYLFWTGRGDDIVKVADKRISIKEIEAALRTARGVRDVAVLLDPKTGFLTAFVVSSEPAPDIEGLKKSAVAVLGEVSLVPKTIVFLDALPLTVNGKVDYHRLRENVTA
jgi:acyl-coenzyme A synthetase/AMP-(fatty) acid ligase